MERCDDELMALAERQHGLVADRQALALGLSRSTWRNLVGRHGWERLDRSVVRRTGSPPGDQQAALAGVLAAGPSAYGSHHSASALWGVPGFRVRPMQVMTRRRGKTVTPLAQVHHPRHLPDPFSAVIDGVPVVRPALMLLQMAPLVHPEKLHRMLDNLWSRRVLSGPAVRAELAPLMHRGRPGTAAMRDLLDSLPEDYVPTASNLEARFARIIADAGLPAMRRQIDLGDDERWCGRVDFLAADVPLVVEVDSDRFHTALTDEWADAVRRRRLGASGFEVVEVSEFEIWHRPRQVVAKVRAARRRLLAAA